MIIWGDHNVVVVPFKVCLDLVVVLHFNYAHIGRDKLLSLMSKLLWHPKKYNIVSDVATTCVTCQMSKDFGSKVIPPTLRISTSYPFELLAVDLMSLPKTSSGFVACLVTVDHFTKFDSAVPLRNKQSKSVISALSRQVLPFLPAVPTCLLSDHGPEFTSDEFYNFLLKCDISHRLTTPYTPTSNGAVERVNRTIQNLLRTIVTEGHRWDEHLSRAVIAYNNSPHAELGMSPSQCLMTRNHSMRADPPLQPELREVWREGHPKFLPFKVGEQVVKRIEAKGHCNANKFMSRYRGPFEIVKVDEKGLTYKLEHCATGEVIKAHHNKLKVFKQVPHYIVSNEVYRKLGGLPDNEALLQDQEERWQAEIRPKMEQTRSSVGSTIRWLDDFSTSGEESLSDSTSSTSLGSGSSTLGKSGDPLRVESSWLNSCSLSHGCSLCEWETKLEMESLNQYKCDCYDRLGSSCPRIGTDGEDKVSP